jgi:oxygen-independent coproporphyrinogen III oxidase
MAGIYLHIPFCKQACSYCNFYFSTSQKSRNDLVAALLKESQLRSGYLEGEAVETIYFGGGTPSLLTTRELELLLEGIFQKYEVSPGAEITWEANPDDIRPSKIKEWKNLGVNRLSIGVQSFFDADLSWMNRAHHASQALDSIRAAQDGGLDLTIDLIYGSPSLSDENWQKNIDQAISFQIPHLSCYALTVETGTALFKKIAQKKTAPVDPSQQVRQFQMMTSSLGRAGYEHYEISNFAQPGKRSRHNSSYWSGKSYLGLGPSAHSYNGSSRQWNVSSISRYISSLHEGKLDYEKEDLTNLQVLNEYIMTRLRTIEGISLEHVKDSFGPTVSQALLKRSEIYSRQGKIIQENDRLSLTQGGKLFADGIAADLFFDRLADIS